MSRCRCLSLGLCVGMLLVTPIESIRALESNNDNANETLMTTAPTTAAPSEEVTVPGVTSTSPFTTTVSSTAPTIPSRIGTPPPVSSDSNSEFTAPEWLESIDAKHAAWFMVVMVGVAVCICCGCCLLLFCLRISRREAKEMKMKFDCTLSELHRIRASSEPAPSNLKHMDSHQSSRIALNGLNGSSTRAVRGDSRRNSIRNDLAVGYMKKGYLPHRQSSSRPSRDSYAAVPHSYPMRTYSHFADEYKVNESTDNRLFHRNGQSPIKSPMRGPMRSPMPKLDENKKFDETRPAMVQFKRTATDLQSGAFSSSSTDSSSSKTDSQTTEMTHLSTDNSDRDGTSDNYSVYTTASEYTKTTGTTQETGATAPSGTTGRTNGSMSRISALSPITGTGTSSGQSRSGHSRTNTSSGRIPSGTIPKMIAPKWTPPRPSRRKRSHRGSHHKYVQPQPPTCYVKSHRNENRESHTNRHGGRHSNQNGGRQTNQNGARHTLTDSERWNAQMRELQELHNSLYGDSILTKEVKRLQEIAERRGDGIVSLETTQTGDGGEYDMYSISSSEQDKDESSEARMTRKVTSLGVDIEEEGIFDDFDDHPYVD